MNQYLLFVYILIIVSVIDYLMIGVIAKNMWDKQVNEIQGMPINVRLGYGFLAYIFIAFAVYYFIIKDERSYKDAFILGLLVYGIFDFTNLAIFNKYKLYVGLIDIVWGATLFALTTFIIYKLKQKKLIK